MAASHYRWLSNVTGGPGHSFQGYELVGWFLGKDAPPGGGGHDTHALYWNRQERNKPNETNCLVQLETKKSCAKHTSGY